MYTIISFCSLKFAYPNLFFHSLIRRTSRLYRILLLFLYTRFNISLSPQSRIFITLINRTWRRRQSTIRNRIFNKRRISIRRPIRIFRLFRFFQKMEFSLLSIFLFILFITIILFLNIMQILSSSRLMSTASQQFLSSTLNQRQSIKKPNRFPQRTLQSRKAFINNKFIILSQITLRNINQFNRANNFHNISILGHPNIF